MKNVWLRRGMVVGATAGVMAVLGACSREKPNANRDIKKNQGDYMNQMDAIAAKLEAEEKAKLEAEAKKAAEPAAEPKEPAKEPDKNLKPGG